MHGCGRRSNERSPADFSSGPVLIPMPVVDIESLRAALQEASLAGVGVSFLTGLVFSFNPVSIASIPVVLAYVTKAQTQRRAVLLAAAFVGGMLATHAVLGVAAALGGEWVKRSMGHGWELLLAPLLVVLGLTWPGWLRIRVPWVGFRGSRVTGMWGAFLLGIPFSVAICPFCTPALVVTLTASAAIGSVPYGLSLLLAFALGRSIPILLGAWSIGWLESLQGLQRLQKAFEVVAGLTLILAGLYLAGDYVLNHH